MAMSYRSLDFLLGMLYKVLMRAVTRQLAPEIAGKTVTPKRTSTARTWQKSTKPEPLKWPENLSQRHEQPLHSTVSP